MLLAGLPLVLLLAGCAAPASPTTSGSQQSSSANQSRTLRIGVRNEVDNLAPKVVGPNGPARMRRMFNAAHGLVDDKGEPHPYLAEELPRLNTDTWRVQPDGRMETTYRLRPGLTWHDGRPLTADDFLFGWRLYASPLAIFVDKPQDLVEDMLAPDARTIVIRWTTTYTKAGELEYADLEPLPRHILEEPFRLWQQGEVDQLVNHPFWTSEYVGAGPYKLVRWDAGYEVEGVAFDGHALGRPKIDRVVIRIYNDENVALTAILSGALDYTEEFLLSLEHVAALRADWGASHRGEILVWPDVASAAAVQYRPEYQKSPPLLDPRVRRAMAHSIDRQAINEGVFNGEGLISETFVSPRVPYYAELDRAIAKYPYDPRRTEQLMTEAGLTKDTEGFFAGAGGRFKPDFWATAGAQSERNQTVVSDVWKRSGIDNVPFVLSIAAGRDNETRATFPGITQVGITSTESSAADQVISSQIGTAANRWRGSNRGGYANPEIDRLWDAYNTRLDRSERDRAFVQFMKIVTEELPIFTWYLNIRVRAHVAELVGPAVTTPYTLVQWNIHEWAWK
jgi:peptide/nickel transport system substrate-binding protein